MNRIWHQLTIWHQQTNILQNLRHPNKNPDLVWLADSHSGLSLGPLKPWQQCIIQPERARGYSARCKYPYSPVSSWEVRHTFQEHGLLHTGVWQGPQVGCQLLCLQPISIKCVQLLMEVLRDSDPSLLAGTLQFFKAVIQAVHIALPHRQRLLHVL